MLALLRSRARFSPALLVDGIATALAVAALSAAIVFQTALEYASGDAARGRHEPRVPDHRPVPARRRRRRPGRHRLAPGPHLGAARRRHPAVLVRGLGVPRARRRGHLRVRRLVRRRLVGRACFLIALAAWQPPPRRRVRAPSDSLRLIAAPLASGAVALELLVYGSLGDLNSARRRARRRRARVRDDPPDADLPPERRHAAHLARRGADRRADRSRQPPRADPRARRGARGGDPRVPARARALRPRRLQALQRHLRPPRRRRPAGPPGREPAQAFLGARGTVFRMGGDEFCALVRAAPRGPRRAARRRRARR